MCSQFHGVAHVYEVLFTIYVMLGIGFIPDMRERGIPVTLQKILIYISLLLKKYVQIVLNIIKVEFRSHLQV